MTGGLIAELVIFALASRFRLFLASYARLLIMLSFANLLLNSSLCAVSFETTQSAVQRLVFFNDYIRHVSHPTSLQLWNSA